MWDNYLSMDLKIHEDVQGNVFVKASLFVQRWVFCSSCAKSKPLFSFYLEPMDDGSI